MGAGHRQRVYKKIFDYGIDVLQEHEFLELCLFSVCKMKNTNGYAHALLDKFGNLESVCNASEEELMKIEGIGKESATFLRLIPEIARGYYVHTSKKKDNKYIDYEDIAKRCVAILSGLKNEAIYVLCFDSQRHLIKETKIAEGSPGCVSIEPRKVVEAIVATSTTSIAMCHNHPSGVLVPSREDLISTQAIITLMNNIKIEFIDHFLVANGEWVSCINVDRRG